MNIEKIAIGKNAPEDVNVIIEIPMNSDPVKYEFDKEAGAIIVDRFIPVSMYYPCNYGFIPHTLSDDGDPADVLVLANYPLTPGCVINVKPVGVLLMEDESGHDEKILAVPSEKLDPIYKNINSYKDLDEIIINRIEHFFSSYKALEKNKWVKVTGWEDAKKAKDLIVEAIERAK